MRVTRETERGRTRAGSVLATGCLLAALHAGDTASAQPPAREQATRPRIGLVLGGGGAKGAAHIGVIKVLEEMRIPVDCIAGTSMGSIVGAAYATGMPAQQLEQIITAVKWKEILASAPRQEIPVHRKSQDFVFTMGLELGVKAGALVPPGGIVPTHQIDALLRRIVAGAGNASDFDALPIPFRAVATNLETGAMTVFDRGDLAMAMRASMAVPGAFAPVEYDGQLHVDGMLVRNLPVDVARSACADVVIAVPVGSPPRPREMLGSLFAVAGQAMDIAIDANEKAQLATLGEGDVAIPVVLDGIGSVDFAKVPDAIPIGEEAARRVADALSRYRLPPGEYAEWRTGLVKAAAGPAVRIDELRLTGFEATNPEVARTFIRSRAGDPYDPQKADADATRLVGRGDYSAVSYGIDNADGRNVLTLKATEKPWGPNYLLSDINLSTDFRGDTAWGLRMDYERRWLNSLGGEFRTALQFGRPNFFGAEFYQPLDLGQRFFVAPSVFANQTLAYLYGSGGRIAQLDSRRYGIQLDAGAALGTWGEFRAGIMRGEYTADNRIAGSPFPDPGPNALGAFTTRFIYDTLDKRMFATRGAYAIVTGHLSETGLGAEKDYRTVAFQVQKTASFGRNVWTALLRGGSDLDSDPPFYDQFKVGGLFNFSGYRVGELIGREYAFGALQLRRRVADLNETLGTGVYVGATVEVGNVFERFDAVPSRGLLAGGSVFVGIDSKVGPIYLAYGLSQGGHHALYLYVGASIEAVPR